MDLPKDLPVSAQQIMLRRHWALITLRTVSLVMIIFGGVHVLWGIGASLGLNDLNVFRGLRSSLTIFWRDNWNPVWFGMAVLLPGVALAVLDRRIVHWLIPVPRRECPQCGYGVRQLTGSRCPECGYELQSRQSQAE
jgi:hypothetical protein